MKTKKSSLPLWQLVEKGVQEEAVHLLEHAYLSPDSEFGPRAAAIKSVCVYVGDDVQLLVNCSTREPPDDHVIALFSYPTAEDDDNDPRFKSVGRLQKEIKGLGFRDASFDVNLLLSQLYATDLYRSADTERLLKKLQELLSTKIKLDADDRDDYDNEADLILDELYGQGLGRLIAGAFYYRQALLLEKQLRRNKKLETTKSLRVWCALHDSLERPSARLLAFAKAYAGKGLDTYLRSLGAIR